jgi:hypothetical protein
MVARKRMTKPILTINSEIVGERILQGDQQDRVLASYTTLHTAFYYLLRLSFPLVKYYVITVKHAPVYF